MKTPVAPLKAADYGSALMRVIRDFSGNEASCFLGPADMRLLCQLEKQVHPEPVLRPAIEPRLKRAPGNRRGAVLAMPVDCSLDCFGIA
jgi:hypothetical protein